MNDNLTSQTDVSKKFHFLLADDDADDRYFFETAIKKLLPQTSISSVEDGEKLMSYLSMNENELPDVLFLDLNMPRKNGSECLAAMKLNQKLKGIAVIIYSTAPQEESADHLYANGAYYYVRKRDLSGLDKVVNYILTLLIGNKLFRPSREQFVLNLA